MEWDLKQNLSPYYSQSLESCHRLWPLRTYPKVFLSCHRASFPEDTLTVSILFEKLDCLHKEPNMYQHVDVQRVIQVNDIV